MLKKFIYNSLLSLLNIVFPIITFPYISRKLGVEGVGLINFSLTFIQYFILISQVGIPLYAIRELSKVKGDNFKYQKTVTEIFILNIVSTVASYLILFIIICYFESLAEYKTILFILSINIISTTLGVEWFFQANGDFKYITIRSFFVKLISFLMVILFVKSESDIVSYAIILVLSLSIGYLFNFVHFFKKIGKLVSLKKVNLTNHLKPLFIFFVTAFVVNLYVNLDKIMLVMLKDNESLGLYISANQIVKLLITLVSALGIVTLPTLSLLYLNKKHGEIREVVNKSTQFIFLVTIPFIFGINLVSKEVISIFAGSEFIQAQFTLSIMSPLMLIISLNSLINSQIIIPFNKEFTMLKVNLWMLTFNFITNYFMIKTYGYNGAAIVSVLTELFILIILLKIARSSINYKLNLNVITFYFTGSLTFFLIVKMLLPEVDNDYYSLIFKVIVSSIIYVSFLALNKDYFFILILKKITKKEV